MKSSRSAILFAGAQGLSSLINFLLSFVLARETTIEQFGLVALVLSIVTLIVASQRAIVGDTAIVFTRTNPHVLTQAISVVRIASLLTGLVCVALSFVFSTAFGPALGLVGFLFVLSDGYRYMLVSAGRPRAVLVSNVVWFVGAALAGALSLIADLGPVPSILLWVAAGCVAVVILEIQIAEAWRGWSGVGRFFAATKKLSGWMALQYLLTNGIIQGTLIALAAVVGAASYGGYRAIQLVISPLLITVTAASSPLLSWVAARYPSAVPRRVAFLASSIFGGLAGLAGAIILIFGDFAIWAIPGAKYLGFDFLLLPAVLAVVFAAANVPISAALQVAHRGREMFFYSSVAAVISCPIIIWAGVSAGVGGAAWALALMYALISAACGLAVLLRPQPLVREDVE